METAILCYLIEKAMGDECFLRQRNMKMAFGKRLQPLVQAVTQKRQNLDDMEVVSITKHWESDRHEYHQF